MASAHKCRCRIPGTVWSRRISFYDQDIDKIRLTSSTSSSTPSDVLPPAILIARISRGQFRKARYIACRLSLSPKTFLLISSISSILSVEYAPMTTLIRLPPDGTRLMLTRVKGSSLSASTILQETSDKAVNQQGVIRVAVALTPPGYAPDSRLHHSH
jgi:hypothetical protein